MLVRMAETFSPYLTLSIIKTPVIHGTSDTRVQAPYPTEAWICFALVGIEKKRIGRSKPLPYKGVYLLRV